MSYTTDLMLCCDYSGDKGIEPFLKAIAGVERFGDTLRKLDMHPLAGGTRLYTGAVYALGTNYFPTQDLQELIDGVKWSAPGNVVLVVCSQDWTETRIIRPAYEIEIGGRWDCESRAVQVAPKPEVTG
ncbi:hypothetical protein [Nocardia sp. NBC_01327]|uniref:hypothetical protein n=1 Tax=Nocardia sp. NBC_01327 TaxID=2903593 RepID=UPI002E114BC6|nr:hypothetical protein OG326_24235 [Nocardia sp. NBC_01327]